MAPTTSKFVQKTFSPIVSRTYELVNHILTFGHDILWRRQAARIGAASGGTQWADMCTGTGEMAACLCRLASRETTVYAVDFSLPMMAEAMKKQEILNIDLVVSDVKTLGFPNESLDLITISFATRNINLNRDVLTDTFTEFRRVLKPGGFFVNLETSQPSSWLIRLFFHTYVKLFVKPVGGLISGSYRGYAYLRHTIPRFYQPEELSDIMRRAGFENVTYKKLMFGIAAIHTGMKRETTQQTCGPAKQELKATDGPPRALAQPLCQQSQLEDEIDDSQIRYCMASEVSNQSVRVGVGPK